MGLPLFVFQCSCYKSHEVKTIHTQRRTSDAMVDAPSASHHRHRNNTTDSRNPIHHRLPSPRRVNHATTHSIQERQKHDT